MIWSFKFFSSKFTDTAVDLSCSQKNGSSFFFFNNIQPLQYLYAMKILRNNTGQHKGGKNSEI